MKDFEFALGWNYSSTRSFTKLTLNENAEFGLELDPDGINTSRFKDYHRLDASVIYRFNINTK